MNYCGIDLGGVSSYVYLTTDRGRKLWSGPVETTKEALRGALRRFRRDGLSVAIEAGNQTAWIYEVLVAMGVKVTVVNPNKVKLIAESRRKTDKVDARILCELLRIDALPHPVHMPGRETRALRGLLVARRQLVAARTKLCNVVRGMMRQEGLRLPTGALSSLVGWERIFINSFSCDHVMAVVKSYYQTFKALTQSIHMLERQLAQRERSEPREAVANDAPSRADRLADVLGGGGRREPLPVVAEAGGLLRVSTNSAAEQRADAYGPISREGRRELRAVWVQIAHLVAIDQHRETQPLRTWFNRVARRRGKKTAVVALARRLLVIAYHLLREEADYDAARLRRRTA